MIDISTLSEAQAREILFQMINSVQRAGNVARYYQRKLKQAKLESSTLRGELDAVRNITPKTRVATRPSR